MAQEVRKFTWCDIELAESPDDALVYEPGETHTVTVDNGKTMTVDLCERHHKALLGPVVDLLTAHGYREDIARPTVAPAKASGWKTPPRGQVHPCLWCDRTWSSVSGLAGHLHVAHGFPARGDGRSNLSLIYNVGRACPYCGREMGGNGPQRLGIHMARTHAGEPTRLAASFVRAREMGDPHGVVAKVLAMVGPDGQYIDPAKPTRRKR